MKTSGSRSERITDVQSNTSKKSQDRSRSMDVQKKEAAAETQSMSQRVKNKQRLKTEKHKDVKDDETQ